MFSILEDKNDIEHPLVSVLLPVYNAEKYLTEALESLCKQSYTNLEILLVNDGSTDSSTQIIKQFALRDGRIKPIENEVNKGLIYTLNKGLEYCTGKYIARMDADDLIHLQRIEKQVAFLEKNVDYAAVSSWMQLFDEKGKGRVVKYRTDKDEIKATIPFYSPVSHAASLFKSAVLKEHAYRAEYTFCEDYDLWFRIMQQYPVGVIPEVLYNYRSHDAQTTHPKNKETAWFSHQKIAKIILEFLKVPLTDETINFHVAFCMQGQPMLSKEVFIQWDQHLRKFLNKKTPLINHAVFAQFVFTNYWQNTFAEWFKELSFLELNKILASPFCKFSTISKSKYLAKKLIS